MFVLLCYKRCLHAKDSLSLISPKTSWVKLDIILHSQSEVGVMIHHLRKLYLTDTSVPMDIWNDILQSLVVCRRLTFLDVPDVLDKNGYYLQIRGSIYDDKLQEPEVWKIFFAKCLNSVHLKSMSNFFSKAYNL